jgi:hypothetical protein
MTDALYPSGSSGDVEVARSPDGDPAGVRTGFLADRDSRTDEVTCGVAVELLGTRADQATEAMPVRGGTSVGTAPGSLRDKHDGRVTDDTDARRDLPDRERVQYRHESCPRTHQDRPRRFCAAVTGRDCSLPDYGRVGVTLPRAGATLGNLPSPMFCCTSAQL